MTDKTSIGDRFKRYENASRVKLTPRMPTIIRVDGKAFSTFTRGLTKPWDETVRACLTAAATGLMEEIQGAEIAYVQSDEISVLLNDYKRFDSQPWFDKNVQKMASVSASIATACFNQQWAEETRGGILSGRLAMFDSRVFVVPREEVVNYFYWRQRDATRNSVSGLAQSAISHTELQNKNVGQMTEMLRKRGIHWDDCETWQKRGWCVVRKSVTLRRDTESIRSVVEADLEIPDFAEDREYIERCLIQIEE